MRDFIRTALIMLIGLFSIKAAQASTAADLIHKAVTKVLAEGKTLTRDLGGKSSTTQMGDAIVAAL